MLRFSAAEAAVLAEAEVKSVHNAVDDLLPEAAGRVRSFSAADVLALRAAMAVASLCSREARRRFVVAIRQTPRTRYVDASKALRLDVRSVRRDMLGPMRTVRALRHLATVDPEILGGTPVFRGTRVPIELIAAMVESGEPIETILSGYPTLDEARIRLAPLWVKTYPRRGRPAPRPWAEDGRAPDRTTRIAADAAQ